MASQEKTKLTLRINARLVEQAKQFASQHDTSVSQLVETFFQDLARREGSHSDTPVLDQLMGILPEQVDFEDYYDHLVEKYGRK